MMMKKIIATVRAVRMADALHRVVVEAAVEQRPAGSRRSAPTAPASLGVDQPNRIAPLIRPIRNTGGRKALSTSGAISPFGTWSRSGGSGGASDGLHGGEHHHEDDIEADQSEARPPGRHEHVADRDRHQVGHDDQHDAGRDQDAERAGGGDGAARQRMAVALAHHGRQRQRGHHRDRGADDAGHRGEDRAHDGDGERQRAGHPLQEHLHAVEQVAGDAAALHHDAHEDERRHRDQHQVLGRLAPDPRQEIEELDQREHAKSIADQAVEQSQST